MVDEYFKMLATQEIKNLNREVYCGIFDMPLSKTHYQNYSDVFFAKIKADEQELLQERQRQELMTLSETGFCTEEDWKNI